MSASFSLHFAAHGAIVLLSGLTGGIFFARAIKRSANEVPWRVVHSGGCSAGAMLLAIAYPIQLVVLESALVVLLSSALILGTYLLVFGMYIAAIWSARGIPGGGGTLNRIVARLYFVGTALSLLGAALLVVGLLRAFL